TLHTHTTHTHYTPLLLHWTPKQMQICVHAHAHGIHTHTHTHTHTHIAHTTHTLHTHTTHPYSYTVLLNKCRYACMHTHMAYTHTHTHTHTHAWHARVQRLPCQHQRVRPGVAAAIHVEAHHFHHH